MPNFGYHLARAEGHAIRAFYAATLSSTVRRRIKPSRDLPFEVFSYSGERALPEQVASIRSFLRHAGRPRKFTVVSDNTHSPRSLDLLRGIDPVVAVAPGADWFPKKVPAGLHNYLRDHPTGKQLAVIMSLPASGPALYIDSDVLFFGDASNLVWPSDAPAHYLPDCHLSADERLFRSNAEKNEPVNTGVLFLNQKLDWLLSVARFLELQGAPNFFTNQTMTHLTMHANGARPLDPEKFVLQLDDQFVFRDRYASSDIVLRHYVNPVRHKFWTALRY